MRRRALALWIRRDGNRFLTGLSTASGSPTEEFRAFRVGLCAVEWRRALDLGGSGHLRFPLFPDGPLRPKPAQPIERKLAAIFAADVAGYSRLMGQDEVGTLRTLAAHREIMDRLIGEQRGRIANTAGDSVLAEFPSVVDAVQCAVEIQKAIGGATRASWAKTKWGR